MSAVCACGEMLAMSQRGGTCGEVYALKSIKLLHSTCERGIRTKCEKQHDRQRGQWRRRARSAPHAGAEIQLHTMLKTSVELISTWHSVELPSRMLQPWRAHARASCSNHGLCRGAYMFPAGAVAVEQCFPQDLIWWDGATLEKFIKECIQ